MRIFGLRGKILLLLGVLLAVNTTGALVTLWYAQRTQSLYADRLERSIHALTAAMELQNALVSQRGFVTYYFLNGEEHWLTELENLHGEFQQWLRNARESAVDEEAVAILNRIDSEYVRYAFQRERVITLYQEDKLQAGADLHWQVRSQFFTILDMCEAYKDLHSKHITQTREEYHRQAGIITWLAWGAIPVGAVLGFLLLYFILHRVLAPINRLINGLSRESMAEPYSDEIQYLGSKIQNLLKDVDLVQSKLARSREELVQSEKMALVGKLAAGVAHSVRNPLTSVKMRLFTLRRSLILNGEQKEDFEVIEEEVSLIDTILRNFLEFSRPPKLKMQDMSMSDVVDQALLLVRHRVESMGAEVVINRDAPLPRVAGDPDQLKEVVVNLLVNAMDIIGQDGTITIDEKEGVVAPYGDVCIVQIADSGPGIPDHVQERIFEPFFSTKEEGSGLGLAIARRIVDEHGGWIHVHSEVGKGTRFVIGLPRKEKIGWLKS